MPTFPQLEQLTEPFYPFYVITSVRKFFFFLDPKRTGKIQIKDMLTICCPDPNGNWAGNGN